MVSCYVLVSVFLLVFNIVNSTPVREKYVVNKIPVAVEKPSKLLSQNKIERPLKENSKTFDANDDETSQSENGKMKTQDDSDGQNENGNDSDEEQRNTVEDESDDEEQLIVPGKDGDRDKAIQNKDDDDDEEEMTVAPKGGDKDKEQVSSGKDGENRNTALKNKVQQRDKSFQKYHVEKFGFMQQNMATSWPLGIIPYNFDTSSFDNILAVRVRDAMDFLESASCVQFKAISGRTPVNYTWIHITNPHKQRECSHTPKRKSTGEIVLILGFDCLKRRDILHSLLHAIGFADEVTHPHRDQYIRIIWYNLQPKYQRLFGINQGDTKSLVEYDPMSIMHFHDRAFSKNGHATIVPLMPGLQIQPSDKLSQLDKMKLRLAFGHECNRRTVDDLFDTCKTVMHKAANGEEDDNQSVVQLHVSGENNGNDILKGGGFARMGNSGILLLPDTNLGNKVKINKTTENTLCSAGNCKAVAENTGDETGKKKEIGNKNVKDHKYDDQDDELEARII